MNADKNTQMNVHRPLNVPSHAANVVVAVRSSALHLRSSALTALMRQRTISSTAGRGETRSILSAEIGCAKESLAACRNMRFSPCFFRARLSSKSPYLSSPRTGWPRCARCTRIWCVRPVRSSASRRLNSAPRSTRRNTVSASWPSAETETRFSPALLTCLASETPTRWRSLRNRDAIAREHLALRPHALAVDAHFAAAQDAVDAAFRDALQARQQVVVDALPRVVLGHVDPAHRGRRGMGWFAFGRHPRILYLV